MVIPQGRSSSPSSLPLEPKPPRYLPVCGELLDPAVQAVDDPNVVVGVERQTGGAAQLPFVVALFAPGVDDITVAVEDGDPVQPLVGGVDVLVLVHRDGGQPDELVLAVVLGPSEFTDELFADGDLGDAAVPAPVGHVHYVAAPEGDTVGLAKSGASAALAAYVVAILPASARGYRYFRHVLSSMNQC